MYSHLVLVLVQVPVRKVFVHKDLKSVRSTCNSYIPRIRHVEVHCGCNGMFYTTSHWMGSFRYDVVLVRVKNEVPQVQVQVKFLWLTYTILKWASKKLSRMAVIKRASHYVTLLRITNRGKSKYLYRDLSKNVIKNTSLWVMTLLIVGHCVTLWRWEIKSSQQAILKTNN